MRQTTHFLNVAEPLALDGGRTLATTTIAYQTWGALNAERSNAILIFHALSAMRMWRASMRTGAAGGGT